MPGVGNEIKTRKPSDEDWEVVYVMFHTMKEVVASVNKNELMGRRWLLSYAVMDIVGIYLLYCDQSLLAPAKTSFAYILHYFKNLLIKKDSIEYMYVPIPGVGNEIKTRKPLDEDWEVVYVMVHTMKEVVASV